MIDYSEFAYKIVDSVLYSRNQLILNFNCTTNRQNQMIMLIKPEVFLTECKNDMVGSVSAIMKVLENYKVDIDGIYTFTSEKLRKEKLIEQHYRFTNIMSMESSKILDEYERINIYKILNIDQEIPIFGGHEYLKIDTSINAMCLNEKWMAGSTTKIRNGLYVQKFESQGNNIILVNGFYPAQLEHFTKDNRHVVVLLIHSDLPWKVLRRYMLGSTFPDIATNGSMRNILYNNAKKYGLRSINVSNNCVHLSAGPFEAALEIYNILSYLYGTKCIPSNLNLVRALKEIGVDPELYNIFLNNPEIVIGRQKISLFDITEEVDTYAAVFLYKQFSSV